MNHYYYQPIQYNHFARANDNANASGYITEEATPKQALLTQGDSGKIEGVVDWDGRLDTEDMHAADQVK